MALIVSVYRNAEYPGQDFTNGGISSRFTKLCIVNVSGPVDPLKHADAAPALLVAGALPGIVRIVPAMFAEWDATGKALNADKVARGESGEWVQVPGWSMMGGNYASTSDSRFGEAVERITGKRWYGAVAIHDRYEG